MLSDDNIEKLWVAINKGKFMFAGFNTFARAIEAAVQAEKQEPRYIALAFAETKEAPEDSPVSFDGPYTVDVVKNGAWEKQEPVKDEPVAFVHRNEAGQISMMASDGSSFDMSKFVGSSLYTRPQPDLTAEVERLRNTIMFLRSERPMARRLTTQEQRIAELEAEVERLRQICRDAYEVWAGSNGIPEPITCVEAYMLQLLIAMRDEVKRGLKCPEC